MTQHFQKIFVQTVIPVLAAADKGRKQSLGKRSHLALCSTQEPELHVVHDCCDKILYVVGLLPTEGKSRTVAAQIAGRTVSGNL